MVTTADIAGIASVLTPNPTLTPGWSVLGSGATTTTTPPTWYERILDWAKDNPTQLALLGGLGGGLMGLFGSDSTANQPQGYQGGIPQYTYNRQQVPYQDENRRPGSGGRRYFNDGQFVPGAAQGGDTTNFTNFTDEQNPMDAMKFMGGGKIPEYQQGGLTSLRPRGMYLGGKTDGMADRVPATISGRQPAQLSDGEFVMPADVVSHLGNGNSDAGAQQLFAMMDRIRKARTGRTQQGPQINPSEFTIT